MRLDDIKEKNRVEKQKRRSCFRLKAAVARASAVRLHW